MIFQLRRAALRPGVRLFFDLANLNLDLLAGFEQVADLRAALV